MLRASGSASCDRTHETGGTIFAGIGLCVLRYRTRDRGYDLLRASGSVCCEINHEIRGTIFCRHWVLHLVISHTRREVRFVTGIGFCLL